jgi:hypothetical protein
VICPALALCLGSRALGSLPYADNQSLQLVHEVAAREDLFERVEGGPDPLPVELAAARG